MRGRRKHAAGGGTGAQHEGGKGGGRKAAGRVMPPGFRLASLGAFIAAGLLSGPALADSSELGPGLITPGITSGTATSIGSKPASPNGTPEQPLPNAWQITPTIEVGGAFTDNAAGPPTNDRRQE